MHCVNAALPGSVLPGSAWRTAALAIAAVCLAVTVILPAEVMLLFIGTGAVVLRFWPAAPCGSGSAQACCAASYRRSLCHARFAPRREI